MLGSFTIAVEGKLQAQKLFGHRFRRSYSRPSYLSSLHHFAAGVDVDDMLNPWAVLNEFEML
ncbi:hypothetical protein HPP92_026446 [Vanilla planifolia]|uniref:Uncharacterized protein n=1 Tax=Vanilla planifolia TaxID=51239 RepID=A0A835PCS9_VANPL|nr:hypothetical protein HPP92_026446 [Vanilla planifolia]